ncbi:MAG: hypothetical protein EBZ74_01785, partial [Planctomycetia bacterium]|nr:hypothetical protein [Planctomycetia bacterium]
MWPFDHGTIPGSRDIEVAAARREGRRVAADIAGRSVWFESDDVGLEPAPEAFAAGFLVPAMHAGRLLTVRSGVCDTWAARLPRLVTAFRHLWYPDAPGAHALPAGRPGPHGSGTALCFSGGVDAFHTLLAAGRRIDVLAYVVGYDVKLRERRRASAVARLLGEVAAETGTRPVVIRTNLRRHPLHRAAPWLRSFGGALAAAGHLLSPVVARLLISSDGLGCEDPEVGARAATDWLHGSAGVEIEHVAPETTRLEKIRTIAAAPLVQRHLRVCWRNVGDRMNCGRCEKCVRTMLALDLCGQLGRFPGFERGRGLEAAIDALPAIDPVVTTFYRDLLANGLAGRT